MKDDILPIFGMQASWVCYKTGGCEHGVPDNADVAFLFLNTFRTKAEQMLESLLEAGIKKDIAIKKSKKIPDGDKQLTRIECPYLGYDEEGAFENVYSPFIKIADREAAQIAGEIYAPEDSCITVAWRCEHRVFISKLP